MAKSEYTDLTYFMIYGYKLVKNSEYVARATNQSETKYYLQKSVAFSLILLSLPCLSEFCHDLISAAKVRVISDMTDSEQLFVSHTLIDTIESDNRRF